MNLNTIFILSLFFSLSIKSQQNFFNVPSSEVTEKNKIFFQQQFNIFNGGLQSNTTFNYGLGKNFEIGANFNGLTLIDTQNISIPIDYSVKPYIPFLLINAQKRFNLSSFFAVSLGFQTGITTSRKIKSGSYSYLNFILNSEKYKFKFIAGTYAASTSYIGEGTRLYKDAPLGLQFGFEKQLLKDRLFFQTDFISGKHNLGEVVIGMACFLNKKWILSAGYQIPTFNSQSVKSLVLEFTFVQF